MMFIRLLLALLLITTVLGNPGYSKVNFDEIEISQTEDGTCESNLELIQFFVKSNAPVIYYHTTEYFTVSTIFINQYIAHTTPFQFSDLPPPSLSLV